ncbi:DUF1573 domain-containing protein [Phaeocystidibacter marisrubri]|uniref:DUF1573 domain-containing protein n=1 Tax=Phaeocystidibacter marisrubri TaxID=1577780 RepID=A0A6L3ZGV9_9FLAO|nr:DUF1573 domain-containing protein [Phaeocystidibacter marisrubri]KAB2817256.1 DUF1573 domain-containing protein [Phaeocystidibacter marisrubri]GGH76222.1 hypothetical protein GCM10011318_24160 [Phaeocystidibacter marisrubri]
MKKLLMTLAVVFFGMTYASAQENPNAPVMTFESTVMDYGTIEQDANGVRVFEFTNTGKEPLIISNLRGSCGCTVPDQSIVNKPIAPGESAEIKVRYDTHRVGRFQKSVTVTSNASQGTIVLTIKGNVRQAQTTPVNENTPTSRVSR